MSRRNPFEEIEEMLDRMGMEFEMGSSRSIAVDVRDRGDAFVVTADIPGVEKEEIDVTLAERTLRIDVEHEEQREAKTGEFVRRERSHTSASRSVRLPETVDEEGIEATYTNGVLRVTLPKPEPDDGTTIEVE